MRSKSVCKSFCTNNPRKTHGQVVDLVIVPQSSVQETETRKVRGVWSHWKCGGGSRFSDRRGRIYRRQRRMIDRMSEDENQGISDKSIDLPIFFFSLRE